MDQEKIDRQQANIAALKTRKNYIENQLHGFRFQSWIMIVSLMVGGLLGYVLAFFGRGPEIITSQVLISRIIIGVIGGGFFYFYITFMLRMIMLSSLRRIDIELAQLGAEELKENIEENFFTKLVQINFKYLDQYYLQTQEQAEKSFRLATFASISGLIVIVIGIFMMYTAKTEAAYVTTAAGIISQFISAIFFFLYNRTILKMSEYHQKLVITQNISLALKMTDDMEKDSKTKMLELIIDRLTFDINKYLTANTQ